MPLQNSPILPVDTKLTEIFTPFIAVLPNPLEGNNPYDFSAHAETNVARKIRAVSTNATIWANPGGVENFQVPVWTYEGSHPGPAFVVRHDQIVEVCWSNDIADPPGSNPKKDGGNHPLEVVTVKSVAFQENASYEPQATFDARTGFVYQGDFVPQNVTGVETVATPVFHDEHRPRARIVTHLHGGRSSQHSDGWPEAMLRPGEFTDAIYGATHPDARHRNGGLLWFHDHAMHTTGYNVMAGLAGLWIIRGEQEVAMGLPNGKDEIPLVIQDRNLIIDVIPSPANPMGKGRLLHKTETVEGPMEFFGPLTLVNGVVWPQARVNARVVRLRFLNGCNSRTLKLALAVKTPDPDPTKQWKLLSNSTLRAYQIGTEQGFLDHPVALPEEDAPAGENTDNPNSKAIYLTLLSGERADVLIDFGDYAGQEIAVFNLAAAPYGGDMPLSLKERLDANFKPWLDDKRVPYPHVLAFSVGELCQCEGESLEGIVRRIESVLAERAQIPPLAQQPAERVIAIVEKQKPKAWGVSLSRIVDQKSSPIEDPDPALVLWELVPAAEIGSTNPAALNPAANPALRPFRQVVVTDECGVSNTYLVVAERFQDPVNFFPAYGATERWRFINLTGDSHPIHLHLVDFRTYQRQTIGAVSVNDGLPIDPAVIVEELSAKLGESPFVAQITLNAPDAERGVKQHEKGPKDTVRIDPQESIIIEAVFKGHLGRYVYHCHLLEHEDHDMMRQFVVARDDHTHAHNPPTSVGI